MTQALLVVGHGTRSAAGAAECEALVDHVRTLRPDLPVAGGNLELCRPAIPDGVDRLVDAGATDVTALPLVLFAARHAKEDIPAALAEQRARRPGLRLRQGAPLGVRSHLVDVVVDRLGARVPVARRERTAVVLVRAGSTDPDAGPDIARVAKMLVSRGPYPVVGSAFAGIAEPALPEVLERFRREGHRDVAVVPYLLFTGHLARRVAHQSADFGEAHPDMTVTVTGHLGPDPRIAALLLDRYEQARAGERCPARPPGRPTRSCATPTSGTRWTARA